MYNFCVLTSFSIFFILIEFGLDLSFRKMCTTDFGNFWTKMVGSSKNIGSKKFINNITYFYIIIQ
jgi:nicotinamide riboside transporter PnuC